MKGNPVYQVDGYSIMNKAELETTIEKLRPMYERGHLTQGYFVFQKKVIASVNAAFKNKTPNKKNQIQAKEQQVLGQKWLLTQLNNITDVKFVKKLTSITLVHKTNKKPLSKSEQMRRNQQERYDRLSKRYDLYLSKPAQFSKFMKPRDEPVHMVSKDRTEFGMYLEEPVQIMGQIKRIARDVDSHGNSYTRLLLINAQFLPLDPTNMISKAIYFPDHIWIDINKPELIEKEYILHEFIVFAGIVGQYRSKVDKDQSQLKNHKQDYWRTKYNVSNPIFKGKGSLIMDGQRVTGFKTPPLPAKPLHAKDMPIEHDVSRKGKRKV